MDTLSCSREILLSALFASGAALLVTVSLRDLAVRLLPNWISLALVCIGIALRLNDATLPISLAAAAAVFAAAYGCWRCGWMGGGDVKLFAACTLLVPPAGVIDLVTLATIAGGVLAIVYLVLGRVLARNPVSHRRSTLLAARIWRLERRRIVRGAPLPYGCAIAGTALVLMLADPLRPLLQIH